MSVDELEQWILSPTDLTFAEWKHQEGCIHARTTTSHPPAIVNPPTYRITCYDCQKHMTETEYNADRQRRYWRKTAA